MISGGIYLVRAIAMIDDPLNVLVQGVPQLEPILPVRN